MGSRTVALQDSAYARLRAARRPGESFTDAVNRILEGSRPTFGALVGALSPDEARGVRDAVGRFRQAEASAERKRLSQIRRGHGSDA